MPISAAVCPHCGYDFPARDPKIRRREALGMEPRTGFAYSDFANVILMLASFLCGLSSVGCLIMAFLPIGQWQPNLIVFLSSSIVSAALSITFLRMLDV
jgi:hypothetical protein